MVSGKQALVLGAVAVASAVGISYVGTRGGQSGENLTVNGSSGPVSVSAPTSVTAEVTECTPNSDIYFYQLSECNEYPGTYLGSTISSESGVANADLMVSSSCYIQAYDLGNDAFSNCVEIESSV